jgi:hypothetical protein
MILADTILAQANSPDEAGMFGAISAFAASLRPAQKFALSDEVAMACHHVGQAKPSSIATAMPFCRSPFPNTWIEWSFSAVQAAGGYDAPRPPDNMIKPVRVGALLQLDQTLQRGRMSLAWDNGRDRSGVKVSLLQCIVDWTENPELCPPWQVDHAGEQFETQKAQLSKNARLWWLDKVERHWMIDQERRFVPEPCCFWNAFFEAAVAQGNSSMLRTMLEGARADWDGEGRFIMAALIMLNSRNCVRAEPADLARLNRARLSRGKPTLAEHTVIRISLSNALARAASRPGATRASMFKHLVRGHFKVRKTGVFWWSPHVRGDIGTPHPAKYEIAA